MKVKLQDTKTGIDLSKLEVGVEYIFILRNGTTKITDKLQRREKDDIYPYSVGWFTAYMKHGNYYLGNSTGLDIVKIKQKVKKTQI